MAGVPGGKRPYARVRILWSMTQDPIVGPWLRGRLALARVKLSAPADVWLDAVYALLVEVPDDALKALSRAIIRKSAEIDPEEARANWGRDPEHQAHAGKLGRGPGVEAGGGVAPELARRAAAVRAQPGARRSLRNPRG